MGAIKDMDEGREIVAGSCEQKEYFPEDTAVWDKQYETAKEIFTRA
jgi:hypothetical protein